MEDDGKDEATQPGMHSLFSSLCCPLARYYRGRPAYTGDVAATQKVLDPRRLGKNASDLSDEDLSDIFCILHPVSLPAIRAAALIHDLTPQHTITSEGNVNIREKEGNPQELGTFVLATQGIVSCDIALRLSANLKSPAGGFLFGRNQQRCDFILGRDDQVKRVSNIHFRIYINEYGILMLEDQSTNGTAVDGNLLRAKEKENGMEYRHTLELGSRIILHMTPPEEDFKFIVRIPRRDEATEVAYQQNLTSYFMRIKNTHLERQARASGRDPVCRLQLYLISILTVYSPTSLPLRMLELPISPHRR
jgi:FHA domain